MSDGEPAHLFVYGTLMTRARGSLGADMRARLKETSISLGDATIPGRLFDMGTFPVMIEAAARSDVVHGEMLHLRDPEAAFHWLDPYEGITPGHRRAGEYDRVRRTVQLASGEDVIAWVYLYVAEVSGLPAIPSGRWMG
jgi:gamma-glutamylcyclotransferase (GGCT)/AIG2-like uncharacterized protein YtfP